MLVVSRVDDTTADLVTAELHQGRVPMMRLDPGDFPEAVTVRVGVGEAGLTGCVSTATRVAELEQVRAVYWRRPRPYSAAPGLEGQDARWCVEEARYGLGGILASLPAQYVNHPWRNRDAEYKPAQLAAAVQCGFDVPPTVLTNDRETAREFVREHGSVVYKPLRSTEYHDAKGRALTVWVDDVDPDDLDDGVSQTMHQFQQRVA
ncbi:MvdC/MvdD family ATP grasp protein [Streptomyces flavofungini]|uniref:MvdC/MvdD family ATP grasp protein n=1 Tax=Streptomyces flavofungini TaxID=68200 RepID=UPI003555EF94